jgi:TDG/mug DNA glycosylase family protein
MNESFGAVCDFRSKVLVLGSLPGVRSLQMQQYYAHPNNHFWGIIFWVFGAEPLVSYEDKLDFLLERRIALWDVVERAERTGSLDGNIRNHVCNDVPALLRKYKGIAFLIFNGGFAERTYKRAFGAPPVPYKRVLSTSPACAGRFEEKRRQWRDALLRGLAL